MIKVQDWMASIPDREKHIAYVGEGSSEIREFLLCGDGWETYINWTFHLDMAFDPESITTRDTRHVVETHSRSNETKGETAVNKDESVTEETYTVHHRIVEAGFLSDVAHLEKKVEATGIRLTWTVLRQHTALPGKLWATLRAVGSTAEKVKKSAIMVFEVDAAVSATPASTPAISEIEQMENRVAHMVDVATYQAQLAQGALAETEQSLLICQDVAREVADVEETVKASAAAAEAAAQQAATERTTAADAAAAAGHYCAMTAAYADNAEAAADAAQEAVGAAQEAATAAQEAATAAETARKNASSALNKCNNHSMRCEDAQLRAEDAKTAAQGACEEAQAFANAAEAAARRAETASGGGDGGTAEYNRVSVRDYGAVGDGVADDRQAIMDAFTAAKSMLPCEVYFPAGTYGISNGITVDMAYGTGGLLVRGAGRDITQIKYLDSYDPDQLGNMWYAIRIWPVGMPDTKPPTDDDYLHDISITGLSVFDPDPCAHAWHPSKGDPSKEETHGFDLQYIKRVSVTDCNLLYVGDEAIDICGCYDVIVMNNHVEGCPAAGTAGGAISIGDGCKGVIVSGNTVNGSAPDETLDDGTVIKKSNFGIAVESLFIPVVDVTITGNVVTNIQGNGINLGATNDGSGLTNILISNNVINNCCIGIDDEGTHPKQGIKICDNLITNTYLKDGDAGHAIRFTNGLVDLTVTGNTIKNIAGDYVLRAVDVNSTQVYADNLIDGFDNATYFGSGDVTFKDCIIKNGGRVAQGKSGTIICTDGDLKVANCTLKNVCNTKGVVGATSVENTDIELINTSGAVTTGDYIIDYSTSYRLKRVIGCRLHGRLSIKKDYAVVQGVIIESDNIGNNAITVAANGVVVTGCVIVTKANNAISETSGYDCNIFANNICRRSIVKTGAHSVSVNNVDLDDMATTA